MPGGLVVHEVKGQPGGIYQGANPPPNTVYDMCNIDISRGKWETRPPVHFFAEVTVNRYLNAIAEYEADVRYRASHYPCHVIVGSSETGSMITATEMVSVGDLNALTWPHTPSVADARYSSVQFLWRYSFGSGNSYAPSVIFSNGVDPVVVYHQDGGSGSLEELSSVDGGYSDITYLDNPPRGKYMAVYKERLFMANTVEGKRTVYHTAPDSAGANVCNVWPSAYNIDVGHSCEINGMVSTRDVLYIFTSTEVFALTGDGVDGIWTIDKIDGAPGASHGCVTAAPDGTAWYANQSGVFQLSGGQAANISHPAIQDSWSEIGFSGHRTFLKYSKNMDILFVCVPFAIRSNEFQTFTYVYYPKIRSWSRWGPWSAETQTATNIAAPNSGTYSERDFCPAEVVDSGLIGGTFIASHPGGSGITKTDIRKIIKNTGSSDKRTSSASEQIVAFIKTNEVSSEDIKSFRHFFVNSRKLGGTMCVIPIVDGEDYISAAFRSVDHNQLHSVSSGKSWLSDSPCNFGTAASGPVDIFSRPPGIVKIASNRSLAAASGGYNVVFSDSNPYLPGEESPAPGADETVVICKTGEFPSPVISLSAEDKSTVGNADCIAGSAILAPGGDQRSSAGIRAATGRSISFLITNKYHIYQGSPLSTDTTIAFSLSGWGFALLRKGVHRLGN